MLRNDLRETRGRPQADPQLNSPFRLPRRSFFVDTPTVLGDCGGWHAEARDRPWAGDKSPPKSRHVWKNTRRPGATSDATAFYYPIQPGAPRRGLLHQQALWLAGLSANHVGPKTTGEVLGYAGLQA